jgi:hypothetical protein
VSLVTVWWEDVEVDLRAELLLVVVESFLVVVLWMGEDLVFFFLWVFGWD